MIFVEYFFLLSNENNIGFKCINQKIVSTNAPAKTFSARKDTLVKGFLSFDVQRIPLPMYQLLRFDSVVQIIVFMLDG